MSARAYPDGKRFAFTILDDTDDATTLNVRPVYEALFELGFRTTKTVWMYESPEPSAIYFAGHTLQNEEYRSFVRQLLEQGFELAWHGASMESSTRAVTERALAEFRDTFGFIPRLHCNHGQNQENIYWGPKRYRNPLLRYVATIGARKGDPAFSGENRQSEYFWGDLCRQHFQYVRNFTFHELDVRRVDPETPYRHDDTPWVNYWFSTTDAPDLRAFNRTVTPRQLDQLCETGGACIISTHLGKGFAPDGRLDPTFRETLRHLSGLPGWYVPASQLLDQLLASHMNTPPRRATLGLELRHVWQRIAARLGE